MMYENDQRICNWKKTQKKKRKKRKKFYNDLVLKFRQRLLGRNFNIFHVLLYVLMNTSVTLKY